MSGDIEKKSIKIDDSEKELQTTDQGYGAFLATRFMFLGAEDTGAPMGKGQVGTKKAFIFLVPVGLDVERLHYEYVNGFVDRPPQPHVFFQKIRLMRQACRQPINLEAA